MSINWSLRGLSAMADVVTDASEFRQQLDMSTSPRRITLPLFVCFPGVENQWFLNFKMVLWFLDFNT